MPSTRTIRRRIKSVKNTAQITKAMQMVAASKMRKAQLQAIAGRPFAVLLNRVLVSLRSHTDATLHPLLEERPVAKELVLLVTTDRGLCGGLNTNIIREASQFDPFKTVFITVGTKGRQALVRLGRTLLADFPAKENLTSADARRLGQLCMDQFLEKKVDKVTVLFNAFINTLRQEPRAHSLLPISAAEVHGKVATEAGSTEKAESDVNEFGYKFEPSAQDVLNVVLPQYVNLEIYQGLLDAKASEHSARMVAMKNATENAKDLVKGLSLEYNKIRQSSITTELLEITSAQLAMS